LPHAIKTATHNRRTTGNDALYACPTLWHPWAAEPRLELLAATFTNPGVSTGDHVAALIDRLVHHAEIISLKGSSYRLRGKETLAEASKSEAL